MLNAYASFLKKNIASFHVELHLSQIRSKGTLMHTDLFAAVLAVWFILSIPLGLLLGAILDGVHRCEPHPNDGLASE